MRESKIVCIHSSLKTVKLKKNCADDYRNYCKIVIGSSLLVEFNKISIMRSENLSQAYHYYCIAMIRLTSMAEVVGCLRE